MYANNREGPEMQADTESATYRKVRKAIDGCPQAPADLDAAAANIAGLMAYEDFEPSELEVAFPPYIRQALRDAHLI